MISAALGGMRMPRVPPAATVPAGEAGAIRALEILRAEIQRTMGVMGLTSLNEITRGHVVTPHEYPL